MENLRKGASEMNTGYMIYQAERPKSAREQREIDMGNARLVAAIGRFGRWVSGLRGDRGGHGVKRRVGPGGQLIPESDQKCPVGY